MEPEELLAVHKAYHESIANAERDPYRFGFVLDHWKTSDFWWDKYRTLLLFGANRSGKTSYGARAVVKAAIENPGSLIYCFSQTEETSLLVQQPAIYLALPAELKVKRTESVTHISYSSQNGFTGNALVLPNGSRIVFKFYTQFQQNQSILEGMELGARDAQWINIGAWLDE